MRHVYEIQAQFLSSPIPAVDPNFIAVKLIGVCAASANVNHCKLIFIHHLTNPNIFAYNALLKSLAQNNGWQDVVFHFNKMLVSRNPTFSDEYTFTSVLKACAGLASIGDGKKIHCVLTKRGFESNIFVKNSLIDMYFKLGFADVARNLFDEMHVRDVVSWNTLVSGYSNSGDINKAKLVFDGMGEKSLVTWSTMICGYTRTGKVEEARKLFDEMPHRNVVCWNAMISGYAQNERCADAIELFRKMQLSGNVNPNEVTLVSVLSACAHLGALDLGKWVEKYIKQSAMELGLFLGNALADMYAKCGCMNECWQVFNTMREKDRISWSIIITGLAMNGYGHQAFKCFDEMINKKIEPTDITFMGLFIACTHTGLVDKGLEYLNTMEKVHSIIPKIEHYGCVVDLLSRAGLLEEAENLINSMPMTANVIIWGSLLGGCRIYKDTKRGERIAHKILELDSEHSGSYVYLANIYTSKGKLSDAAKCRLKLRDGRALKIPGCSWIEVDNTVHEFFMGDLSHPKSEKICLMIRELQFKLKVAGYKPKTELVVHNVNEEEKEKALSVHSERLALAFGLISTQERATIRITKNLRICEDCHDVMKLTCEIVQREIIVRDRCRFHHFKDGRCSCNDYW